MDNPFSADKNNPFQTPYQQPHPGTPGIKPFAALDLAPPAGQNGNRLAAPATPAPSPYLGGDFSSAFMTGREAPMAAPQQPMAPAAANSDVMPPIAPYSQPAVPAPVADYTPAPPASARQSHIMAMTDFNEALSVRKPDFFCTTTSNVDGYQIQSYLGLVSAEVVVPKDILFQNPAAYGELHRMKAAEELLQRVKSKAMDELAERARAMKADGVVGVTLTFSQFDAIVCLCSAVGTAVKIAD